MTSKTEKDENHPLAAAAETTRPAGRWHKLNCQKEQPGHDKIKNGERRSFLGVAEEQTGSSRER